MELIGDKSKLDEFLNIFSKFCPECKHIKGKNLKPLCQNCVNNYFTKITEVPEACMTIIFNSDIELNKDSWFKELNTFKDMMNKISTGYEPFCEGCIFCRRWVENEKLESLKLLAKCRFDEIGAIYGISIWEIFDYGDTLKAEGVKDFERWTRKCILFYLDGVQITCAGDSAIYPPSKLLEYCSKFL